MAQKGGEMSEKRARFEAAEQEDLSRDLSIGVHIGQTLTVNSSQSRGPYNLPPRERDIDNLTYNPQADSRSDNAAFDDTDPAFQPVGARGADNQPTYRNAGREDLDAERSDQTGQIPRGEVDDLLGSLTEEERNVGGRTRGKKVDAYKQERGIDEDLDASGISSADQDVEIGAATGR
ncbi:predicted protein [Postia placenta Mad-698-R]|nr:predicted protein [Postia placenta Mad-698-R]